MANIIDVGNGYGYFCDINNYDDNIYNNFNYYIEDKYLVREKYNSTTCGDLFTTENIYGMSCITFIVFMLLI
jgi:hypothetical protein